MLTPPPALIAQAPADPPVTAIRFAGETQGLDLAMLASLVTVAEGRPVEATRVRESLANLYQTGKFEAIEAAWTPAGEGVALVFTVRRALLITAWAIHGAEALGDEALARAIDLTWGLPLDRSRFGAWSRAIRDRYQREGFPAAKATFAVAAQGPGRAELEVRIEEGTPVRLGTLVIDAPPGIVTGDVRRTLGLAPNDRLARDRLFEGVARVERKLAAEGWVNGRLSWWFVLPGGKRETSHAAVLAAAPATVDLHVSVDPGLRAEVMVEGEPLLPASDLAKAITVFERHSISPYELDASADRLRDLYVGQGWPEAQVVHDAEKRPDGKYRVRFAITPGARVHVAEVRFVGNATLSEGDLRRVIATRGAGRIFGGSPFDPARWADDLAAIAAIYERQGFLDAKVEGVERTTKPDTGDLILTVRIAEGPRTAIARLRFPGLDPVQQAGALQALPIDPGAPYDPRRVPEWVSALQAYFAKTGYPLARVVATLEPGREPQDSALRFDVDLGPAKHVGRVVVRGNVKTADPVIRRQITIKAGDPFDAEELLRTQQQIYQLGFFDRVAVEPIHPMSADPDEPVDLVVAVHERETGWIGFGGGFGSIQGPQASAELLQNNLWGSGRPLRVEGVFSTPRSSFQAALRDPYLLGAAFIGEAGFSYVRERRRPGEPMYQTYGPTVGVSRQVGEATIASLRYGWGRTTYLDAGTLGAEAAGRLVGLPDRVNSVFTTGLTHDTRSDILNPRWGTKADFNVDLGTPLLGGTLTYGRPRLAMATYLPFPRRIVLALGVEGGYVQTLLSDRLLPTDLLFVAGGGASLRGYGFNKVYPAGQEAGGRVMAVAHAELRAPIWGDLGGVAFVDAGDVWAAPQDVGLGTLKVTAGLGARYMTPVGPIRLDYGVRVRPVLEWPGLDGLYVGLGHAF